MEIIYTKHAKERIEMRKLYKPDIEETLLEPDQTIQQDKLNFKFVKTIEGRKYQVVAKYNDEEKKWIIVSAWVRGEEDPPNYLWLIITFPFRALWWLLKKLFGFIWKQIKKSTNKK
ncbi:MAG: DUF4258 domain-containing protein [Pseudomonadales bacterium]|nr:DUF4258 domain-containing protein [Pseudomonadales bacterium]